HAKEGHARESRHLDALVRLRGLGLALNQRRRRLLGQGGKLESRLGFSDRCARHSSILALRTFDRVSGRVTMKVTCSSSGKATASYRPGSQSAIVRLLITALVGKAPSPSSAASESRTSAGRSKCSATVSTSLSSP